MVNVLGGPEISLSILIVASRGEKNILVKNQIQSLNNYRININIFSLEKGIYNYFLAIFRLNKYLKHNKFDIIHAHYGWSGIVAGLAKRKEKLIVSFMGDDLMGSVNKNNKYTLISRCVVLLNILFAKYFYTYSIVKSVSLWYVLHDLKQVAVIPNGVDLSVFYQVEKVKARKILGWDQHRIYIIFVADPNRQEKNFALARAAVILTGNIMLLPVYNIPNNRLYLFYSAADCLLLTSFHEGSPNVIKEGMACNIPIVSTDVGDVRWVLGDTEGCYITSFDPEDAADKIKSALDFAATKGRTNGRERIINLGLDSENIAKKIIKVYETVLRDNKK